MLAVTAVVRCTFTKDISHNENVEVLNSVKDKSFNERCLSPFNVVCI